MCCQVVLLIRLAEWIPFILGLTIPDFSMVYSPSISVSTVANIGRKMLKLFNLLSRPSFDDELNSREKLVKQLPSETTGLL